MAELSCCSSGESLPLFLCGVWQLSDNCPSNVKKVLPTGLKADYRVNCNTHTQ